MMMLDEVEYKNKQQTPNLKKTPNLFQNQLFNFTVELGVQNTIIQSLIVSEISV